MICKNCPGIEMTARKMFGREHHYTCEECGAVEVHPRRLNKTMRDRHSDEAVVPSEEEAEYCLECEELTGDHSLLTIETKNFPDRDTTDYLVDYKVCSKFPREHLFPIPSSGRYE